MIFTAASELPADATVLGVPVYADLTSPDGGGARVDTAFLTAAGFEGKVGQTERLAATDGSIVVAVGVGRAGSVDADSLRGAGAAFARAAGKAKVGAVTLTAARGRMAAATAAQAVVEGIALAAYRYTAHKSTPPNACLEAVTVLGGDRSGVKRGGVIAGAVTSARDWVNEPPRTMTPRRLAEVASELAFAGGLDVEVWEEGRMAMERLGGLLGVSAGAAEPARMIRLVYEPPAAKGTLALVGKGITFDSGGLSLKTSDGMRTMKDDMGGAAAVLAAMGALPTLGAPARVVAYLCCTENMPSGTAMHVGDVLTARNGTTVEVLNTDAEGRLVLADGLSLAVEEGPDFVIDVATLTGGQRVALGDKVAALLTNDDRLAEQVLAGARRAGEPAWRLPLWGDYRRHLDSEVADLKNVGNGSNASAIVAALFLQEFTAGRPWAHLDIAGPSWSDADDGWLTKGGTGWGVRTLIEVATHFEAPARAG
ncbi:MAG TPA: leucyl aminopeptidase [Acidimicrobiales bacterium]